MGNPYWQSFVQSFKQVYSPNDKVSISVIDYGEGSVNERVVSDVNETLAFHEDSSVIWVRVTGLCDSDVIEKIGKLFHIHPLHIKDIIEASPKPKVEPADTYLFALLKILDYKEKTGDLQPWQASLVVGKNFLITFQEKESDLFDSVRSQILSGEEVIRKSSINISSNLPKVT